MLVQQVLSSTQPSPQLRYCSPVSQLASSFVEAGLTEAPRLLPPRPSAMIKGVDHCVQTVRADVPWPQHSVLGDKKDIFSFLVFLVVAIT